jgi:hypothetical protein
VLDQAPEALASQNKSLASQNKRVLPEFAEPVGTLVRIIAEISIRQQKTELR